MKTSLWSNFCVNVCDTEVANTPFFVYTIGFPVQRTPCSHNLESRVHGLGPRGVLPETFGRGVRAASQNPYPIYDQNGCDFPYPIYDLTKNLITYLWSDSYIIRGRAFVAGFI